MSKERPAALEAALLHLDRALGDGRVRTEPDVCAAYAHDESETDPRLPDAVVLAGSSDDVAAVMQAANRWRIPVTPRGGGTGRTGGAVPVAGGIVLAFEQMRNIKEIDRHNLVAVVEPGVVLADLHAAVEAEGLFYPPDPNSLTSCVLGGNVAENAGGPRAFKYGVTRDYVLGMDVVTAGGERLKLGRRTVKGVTGYDLTSLVVGSEGTLAISTELTLKLIAAPEGVLTLMALLPDTMGAARAVSRLVAQRLMPRALELLDDQTLDIVRPQAAIPLRSDAGALLLVELDGDVAALEAQCERAGEALMAAGALDVLVAQHAGDRERLWSARRALSRALRAQARFKLAEDVVVPRSRLPELIATCQRLGAQYGIRMPSYGHAGDGNLHCNLLWDDPDERPKVMQAIADLFRAVVDMGGTLSGEHGIGVLKAPYLGIEQAPALISLQERIKAQFDPQGVLNPGKIFPGHVLTGHGHGHGPC